MKICIDGREFVAHGKTGISRYLENLLTPLVSEPELKIVLFVHDPRFVPEALRNSVSRCVKLPRSHTLLVDQVVLPRLTSKEKADVFFSPYYKIPLSGKFKRIITVHDIMFLRLPIAVKRALVVRQLRAAANKADLILTDSEFTKKDLTDFVPGIEQKVRVLYPSLGRDWFEKPAHSDVEIARLRFTEGRKFLLYVGNFKPHKNVDLLVNSFLKLHAAGKTGNRCLLLAGSDPKNLPRIEALVRSAGKEGLISIYHNVGDSDLKALYSAAEWFVTASEYEGFGYPILEAMTSGCPVICHPCTSIPEVTGDSALEITRLDPENIAEALHRAISTERSERDRLIEKGRARALKFLTGTSSQSFLRIIKTLVQTDK